MSMRKYEEIIGRDVMYCNVCFHAQVCCYLQIHCWNPLIWTWGGATFKTREISGGSADEAVIDREPSDPIHMTMWLTRIHSPLDSCVFLLAEVAQADWLAAVCLGNPFFLRVKTNKLVADDQAILSKIAEVFAGLIVTTSYNMILLTYCSGFLAKDQGSAVPLRSLFHPLNPRGFHLSPWHPHLDF